MSWVFLSHIFLKMWERICLHSDPHAYRCWPTKRPLISQSTISRLLHVFAHFKILLHWTYICLNEYVVTSTCAYTINERSHKDEIRHLRICMYFAEPSFLRFDWILTLREYVHVAAMRPVCLLHHWWMAFALAFHISKIGKLFAINAKQTDTASNWAAY